MQLFNRKRPASSPHLLHGLSSDRFLASVPRNQPPSSPPGSFISGSLWIPACLARPCVCQPFCAQKRLPAEEGSSFIIAAAHAWLSQACSLTTAEEKRWEAKPDRARDPDRRAPGCTKAACGGPQPTFPWCTSCFTSRLQVSRHRPGAISALGRVARAALPLRGSRSELPGLWSEGERVGPPGCSRRQLNWVDGSTCCASGNCKRLLMLVWVAHRPQSRIGAWRDARCWQRRARPAEGCFPVNVRVVMHVGFARSRESDHSQEICVVLARVLRSLEAALLYTASRSGPLIGSAPALLEARREFSLLAARDDPSPALGEASLAGAVGREGWVGQAALVRVSAWGTQICSGFSTRVSGGGS